LKFSTNPDERYVLLDKLHGLIDIRHNLTFQEEVIRLKKVMD